ncbi:alpha/beta hydrolase [Marinifilum sp. D737]|uniref:alpha/beta hydrolase n=1 Tax=Marinifilum sp. D737 TaxID=2969628 RepID=UPI0022749DDD|nr:alpha/beta fold hydrolase [Marinifilum sp. D737]MCY1635498.1 alpha/beta hydrolase-fold protein [Marinifilum sp. D737]
MNKNRIYIKHLVFILTILFISPVYGQKTRESNKIEFHKISSSKRDYILKFTFPPNFDQKQNYKVLYYLDSWFISDLITGSYNVLNRCEYVEDVVLIGISIKGNEQDFNRQRTKDFTPSEYRSLFNTKKIKSVNPNGVIINVKSGVGENGVLLIPENTGGAEEFISFLSKKLFPFVENQYPNLNKRKGLLGHSFGGLFGTYLLQKEPNLIDDYILISGSLSWNESELLKEELFHEFKNSLKYHQLFLTYGTSEVSLTVTPNEALNNILCGLKKKNFNYKFKRYDKANHHSILSRAIYDGLLFLYKK